MRAVRFIVVVAVLGGLAGALTMLGYQLYIIRSSGQLDYVPLSALVTDQRVLLDVMKLHMHALTGAAVGAGLAIAWVIGKFVVGLFASRSTHSARTTVQADPDQVIRDMRARRAEEYLAKRRQDRH